jgi:hypothetical protein
MPASTTLIVNLGTVITNGPGTLTKAACTAAAGPIGDYLGNCGLALLKLQEAEVLLKLIESVSDGSDTSKASITAVYHALAGLGGPDDTLLTTMAVVIAAGPTAASLILATTAAGPIMDYSGNCKLALLKLQEAYNLIYSLHAVTNAADSANLTLLANLLLALS